MDESLKPKILLSANKNKEVYAAAICHSGGIADARYCPELTSAYDGLVLCGGNDITPIYYGEEINGAVEIDEARDRAEIALAKAFIAQKKPILGICRGSQILNVVFGGSLYQDIEEASIHKSVEKMYDLMHEAKAEKGSVFYQLYGEEFIVNSVHHQAVKTLGEGLKVTLTAGKIIEGFEHTKLPIIGIQSHPEQMCYERKKEIGIDGAKLFEYFVGLCKKHRG